MSLRNGRMASATPTGDGEDATEWKISNIGLLDEVGGGATFEMRSG